ncbi:MAG: TSUP family transporter [Clostridia bacterium]|nr:TSUP family transporter [Clostridia bacterium]
MELTLDMFLIVCPLVALAGFVDSIAGGGGLISLPAYYLAGLPASTAAGTNKLSACMGTALATYSYASSGKIEKRIGLFAGFAALLASVLGVAVMKSLSDQTIRILVMCCLPVAAIFTLRGHSQAEGRKQFSDTQTMLISLMIGCVIGFYDGLVGPGTGTFLILLFVHIFGLDDVTASGTAKVPNLMSNIAALTSLFVAGDVLWLLGLPAGLCSMAGAALGSRLTIRKGSKFIRGMMLVVLILLLVKMITDMLQ